MARTITLNSARHNVPVVTGISSHLPGGKALVEIEQLKGACYGI